MAKTSRSQTNVPKKKKKEEAAVKSKAIDKYF